MLETCVLWIMVALGNRAWLYNVCLVPWWEIKIPGSSEAG